MKILQVYFSIITFLVCKIMSCIWSCWHRQYFWIHFFRDICSLYNCCCEWHHGHRVLHVSLHNCINHDIKRKMMNAYRFNHCYLLCHIFNSILCVLILFFLFQIQYFLFLNKTFSVFRIKLNNWCSGVCFVLVTKWSWNCCGFTPQILHLFFSNTHTQWRLCGWSSSFFNFWFLDLSCSSYSSNHSFCWKGVQHEQPLPICNWWSWQLLLFLLTEELLLQIHWKIHFPSCIAVVSPLNVHT